MKAVRLWPPVGVLAMVVLGLVVGKGATGIDHWLMYQTEIGSYRKLMLFFVDPRLLLALFLGVITFAMWQRRWRLAVLAAVCPVVGLLSARLCKRLFGRTINGTLAYPSGHTTVMVVVLGMVVLLAGCHLWVVALATISSILGIMGASMTFHYFTDTVGAALLGTAIVCVAARILHPHPVTVSSPD